MNITDMLRNASMETQGHSTQQNFADESPDYNADDEPITIENPTLNRLKKPPKARIEIDLRTLVCAVIVFIALAGVAVWLSWNASSAYALGTLGSSAESTNKANTNSEVVGKQKNVAEVDASATNAETTALCEQNTAELTALKAQIASGALVSATAPPAVAPSPEVAVDSNGVVNLNLATLTDLQTLKGVGPSTAQKILDYRDQNGKFSSIEELKEVKGIGDATFDKLKDKLRV